MVCAKIGWLPVGRPGKVRVGQKRQSGDSRAILLFSCYIRSILYVIDFIYYFKYKIH
jgi:hypothetical protein